MKSGEIPGMFDGPIIPVSIKISLPIILGNLLQLFYMVADTYFISLIDPTSTALLSGTGLLFPLFFLYIAVSTSLYIGVGSVIGRIIGQKEPELAPSITAGGLSIAAFIAFPALLGGYVFGEPFIGILAGSELSAEALDFALQYFYFLLPGLTVMIFSQVFAGVLQGEGLTGIIAVSMLYSTVANILLDPFCIFVLDMGVAGAGLATSAAHFISSAFIIRYVLSRKSSLTVSFNLTRARLHVIKEIVRIGYPQFINMAALAVAIMILSKLVGGISELYMNAWSIVGRIDQILIIPAVAVGAATITMASQNFGRNNLSRTRAIYRSNIWLGLCLVSLAAVLYIFLSEALFPMFSAVPEVVEAAVLQVRYLSFSFLGIAVSIISSSFFQAVGHPLPAAIIPLLRLGGVTLPLAFVMVRGLGMGMDGIYIALGVGNIFIFPLAIFWVHLCLKKLSFQAVLQRASANPRAAVSEDGF